METAKPQLQSSQLVFTPLMISMVGIACTALVLVLYHYVLTRYCVRGDNTMISQPDVVQAIEIEKKNVIETIPAVAYSKKQDGSLLGVDQSECAVCLGELVEEEVVRLLPNCGHAFHVQCIDQWFSSSHNSNCPVCRSPIVAEQRIQLVSEEEEEYEEGGGGYEGIAVVLPMNDSSHVSVKIQSDSEEHSLGS